MLTKKQQTSELSSAFGFNGLLFTSILTLGLLVGCGGSEPSSPSKATNDRAVNSVAEAASKSVTAPEVADASEAETPESETEVHRNDTAEATAVVKKEVPLDIAAGAELYEKTCKVCHSTGLLSSPKLGDKAAWAPRIAKGKETLYKHSAEGFSSMPAQATGDITESQVYAAVDYMIEQSR